MMVSNRGSVLRLLMWQWRSVAFSSAGGLFAALVWQFVPALHVLWLPTAPLAVVGATLGIFVSFRTNSAYDRCSEGRALRPKPSGAGDRARLDESRPLEAHVAR